MKKIEPTLYNKLYKIQKLTNDFSEYNKNIDNTLQEVLNTWQQITNSRYLYDNYLDILKIYTYKYDNESIVYFLKIKDNKIYSCSEYNFNNNKLENSYSYDLSDLSIFIKRNILSSLKTSLDIYISLLKNMITSLK